MTEQFCRPAMVSTDLTSGLDSGICHILFLSLLHWGRKEQPMWLWETREGKHMGTGITQPSAHAHCSHTVCTYSGAPVSIVQRSATSSIYSPTRTSPCTSSSRTSLALPSTVIMFGVLLTTISMVSDATAQPMVHAKQKPQGAAESLLGYVGCP